MHTRTIAGTAVAPLVGVAAGVTIWLFAPVRGTVALVGGALGGPVAALIVAADIGDQRYLPVAGSSTYLGIGAASLLATFPSEGKVEWLFLGFGGLGLGLFLVRVRTGSLRRLASTPPEAGVSRRLVGGVGSSLRGIQRLVRRVVGTPRAVAVAGVLAGVASAGAHAYGLISGTAPLAVSGLLGLFAVAFLPFYVLTDWQGLDARHHLPSPGSTAGETTTDSLGSRLLGGVTGVVRTASTFRSLLPSLSGPRTASGAPADPAGNASTPADPDPSPATPVEPDDAAGAGDSRAADGPVEPDDDRADETPEPTTGVDLEELSPSVRRTLRRASDTGRRVRTSGTDGVRSFYSDLRGKARRFAVIPEPAENPRTSGPVPEINHENDVVVLGPPDDEETANATEYSFETVSEATSRQAVSIADLDPRIDAAGSEGVRRASAPVDDDATGTGSTVGDESSDRADDRPRDDDVTETATAGTIDGDRPREAVSRRVARVLYGDQESDDDADATADPGDDWCDQLESPEV